MSKAVEFHVGWADDPRARRVGKDGRELFVALLVFCSGYGTDGLVVDGDLREILRRDRIRRSRVDALAKEGLLTVGVSVIRLTVEPTQRGGWLYCPDVLTPLARFRQSRWRRSRGRIPESVRIFVLGRDGHRCVRCGATEQLEMDHIKPWSKGGSDHSSNLQTLCGPCNRAKSDRWDG